MKIVKVFVKNIGEVTFKQSKKYKRLKISLAPFKGIVVTYPLNCSFSSAMMFVYKKVEWIKKTEETIKSFESLTTIKPVNNVIETKFHSIVFRSVKEEIIKVNNKNNLITIYHSENKSFNDPEIQKVFRKIYIKILKTEASSYLPKRVNELATKYNFRYNKISFRNNKSRWGSCNRNNDISLNIHLMRLPYHLIDFVILHELVHTVHKNHSIDFWKCLKSIVKNLDIYKKELKNYHPILW